MHEYGENISHSSSMKLISWLSSMVRDEECSTRLFCCLQMQMKMTAKTTGSTRKGISRASMRWDPAFLSMRTVLTAMQQAEKRRAMMGKQRQIVHLRAALRKQRPRQTSRMREVVTLGRQKEIAYTIQSTVYFCVKSMQFFSLLVSSTSRTTSRKVLITSDGMQAKMMFLNMNFTRFKYFPGARASWQIRRVMKIIQKLAATVKASLPNRLTLQMMGSVQSMQLSSSNSDSRIQLTMRMASTCRMGVVSKRHLNQQKAMTAIRKSTTAVELQKQADFISGALAQWSISIHYNLLTNNPQVRKSTKTALETQLIGSPLAQALALLHLLYEVHRLHHHRPRLQRVQRQEWLQHLRPIPVQKKLVYALFLAFLLLMQLLKFWRLLKLAFFGCHFHLAFLPIQLP